MNIHIGTGGYLNEEWIGLFYPPSSKPESFLSHYAQRFSAVEINSSFYGIPSEKTFANMAKRAQGRLRFSVKLESSFTHKREYDPTLLSSMQKNPQPLQAAGVLDWWVAQFPFSFQRTRANREYLWKLCQDFAEQPLALELRHASWDLDEVREGFAKQGLLWISPDYPPLAGMTQSILRSSGKNAYFRLHGRNAEQWWDGKTAADRHDYRYSLEEMTELAGQIRALEGECENLWVIFNNTTKGHALYNIDTLEELLGIQRKTVDQTGLF
jgi:uncharacterized protein YecE (DUF72 family)